MKTTIRSFMNPLFWAALAAIILMAAAPGKQEAKPQGITASDVICP